MAESKVASRLDSVLAGIVADAKGDIADMAGKQGFVRDAEGKETSKRAPLNDSQKLAAVKFAVDNSVSKLIEAAIADALAGV